MNSEFESDQCGLVRGLQENGLAQPPTTATRRSRNREWIHVYSAGKFGSADVGEAVWNKIFKATKTKRVMRLCTSCMPGYQQLYYERVADPAQFNCYANFIKRWNDQYNVFGKDYNVYGSEADMIKKTNAWKSCEHGWRLSVCVCVCVCVCGGGETDCVPYTRAVVQI